MAVASHEHVVVAVHTEKPPSATEWAEYMALINEVVQTHSRVRTLVSTVGKGGPSSVQRVDLNEFGKVHDHRLSILTDSRLARGIVTALGWLGSVQIRAFAPSDIGPALDYLQVSPTMGPTLLQLIEQARTQLTGPP